MVRLSSFLSLTLLAAFAASEAAAQRAVLLDFSAPGCLPCRQMEPTVARMQQSGLPVRKVDAATEPEIVQQFGIDRFPTFLLVVDGREVRRAIGPQPEHVLRGWLAPFQQPAARVQGVGHGMNQGGAPPATFAASSFNAPPVSYAPPVDGGGIRVGNDHGPAPQITIPGAAPLAQPAMAPPAATAPTAASALSDQLLRASVRLKVKEGSGASYGTGTIIDARQGEALVLTCGHLFRSDSGSSAGPPEIQVELFDASGGVVRVREQVVGQLLSFDLEHDVALVSIRPQATPAVAKIAPSPHAAANGLPVWSVGCDRGADPTVRSGAVTSVDRYQSPPSLTVTGAPVVVRSGGGLFNDRGEVVGVCFGADEPGGEGFYAKLSSIHSELDKLNLTAIYRGGAAITGLAAASPATPPVTPPVTPPASPPSRPAAALPAASAPPAAPPATPAPGMVAVQPRTPPAVMRGQDSFANGALPPLSATERAALEELSRRASESEIVCVIRPREPGGKSEVLTLDRVTPEFLQALRSMGGVVNR